MSIGASLFLVAVGTILYFAVTADLAGIEIATVSLIGILGLVITLLMLGRGAAAGHAARTERYRSWPSGADRSDS